MFESPLNRFIITFLIMAVGQVVVVGTLIECIAWLLPREMSKAFIATLHKYDALSWGILFAVAMGTAIYVSGAIVN